VEVVWGDIFGKDMGKFFEELSGKGVKRVLDFILWGCREDHLFKGLEFMWEDQSVGSRRESSISPPLGSSLGLGLVI